MENIEAIENIDDSIFDSENFPVKDRSHASRRKKTYVKGRNRFNRIVQKGFCLHLDNPYALEGMMRKTNVVVWHSPNDGHRLRGFNKSNECRLASANDKISEFIMGF